jgi:hypothetical protein
MRPARFLATATAVVALGLAALAGPATPAHAADKLHVGKAINVLWIYTVVDVGIEKGIFGKYNLDLEVSVRCEVPAGADRQEHRHRPCRRDLDAAVDEGLARDRRRRLCRCAA